MSNTTKVSKAQANLLATVAKAQGDKAASVPVGKTYRRTADALVSKGLLATKGMGYVVTKAGREVIADTPAKPVAKHLPANDGTKAQAVPTTKGKGSKAQTKPGGATKADLPAVGGVQHPAATWLALLDAAGLSQTKAAVEMGVAPMTLNRLCNGHGLPTAKVTVAFARVVGKPAADVWRGVCDYELAVAEAAAK